MNVPEYRQAIERAQRRFQNTVEKAAEELRVELGMADATFFEEQPKAAMAEEAPDYTLDRKRR